MNFIPPTQHLVWSPLVCGQPEYHIRLRAPNLNVLVQRLIRQLIDTLVREMPLGYRDVARTLFVSMFHTLSADEFHCVWRVLYRDFTRIRSCGGKFSTSREMETWFHFRHCQCINQLKCLLLKTNQLK